MIRITTVASNNVSRAGKCRVYCCANALSTRVFTQPGPIADIIVNQLPAHAGAPRCRQPLVAHDAEGEDGQDRRQGGPARSGRDVPACRDCDFTAVVRGEPAADRRTAAEASADMAPRGIAAVGLKRRAPGPPYLPNGRLLALECTLTCVRMHRVPHPKPLNR